MIDPGKVAFWTPPELKAFKRKLFENRGFPTSHAMDAVRKLILEKADERRTNLSELSKKMGKNHAYLQQFIHREIPNRQRRNDINLGLAAGNRVVDDLDCRDDGIAEKDADPQDAVGNRNNHCRTKS